MKLYLIDLVKQLSEFSEKLDNKTLFVDKKWVLIDELGNQQTFIFERDGTLIMSLNGIVKVGAWRYINEAKSILMDRGDGDQILLNNTFFDSAVMVLKYDGTNDDDLFILANQDIIFDLDVDTYLKSKIRSKFNVEIVNLINGKKLEIYSASNFVNKIGMDVTIDGKDPGSCIVDGGTKRIHIKDNKIIKVIYLRIISFSNGSEMLIEQANQHSDCVGDLVFIEGEPAPSGKYKLGFLDYIKVVDGVIK